MISSFPMMTPQQGLTIPQNFGGLGMFGGNQMSPQTLGSLAMPTNVGGLGNQLAALPESMVGNLGNTTGGFFGNGTGLGFNMPTLNMGLGALQSIGNLAMGFKSYNLMKDQNKMAKEAYNTNINNSIKANNSALEDRLRTRAQMNGQSEEEWKKEYEERKFTR